MLSTCYVTHTNVPLNLGLRVLIGCAGLGILWLGIFCLFNITVQKLMLYFLATTDRTHNFQNKEDGLYTLLF